MGQRRLAKEMLANARRLELTVQVNTTITRRNFHQIDSMADFLSTHGIAMWSVFFLIPVGRGVECGPWAGIMDIGSSACQPRPSARLSGLPSGVPRRGRRTSSRGRGGRLRRGG